MSPPVPFTAAFSRLTRLEQFNLVALGAGIVALTARLWWRDWPLDNFSASAEDEYFSDGLADEMLDTLAKIRGLRVSARASSFNFKGKNASIAVKTFLSLMPKSAAKLPRPWASAP